MTHWDRTADKTSGHLQIRPPQRNELTKFAKKKKEQKRNGNPQRQRRRNGTFSF
jgi:hypothetical protein